MVSKTAPTLKKKCGTLFSSVLDKNYQTTSHDGFVVTHLPTYWRQNKRLPTQFK
eukprot:Pgem_evm1s17070